VRKQIQYSPVLAKVPIEQESLIELEDDDAGNLGDYIVVIHNCYGVVGGYKCLCKCVRTLGGMVKLVD
jgi:hypothetical protein